MAPRANWKGYLKLSLVSCSVALYPATSAASRVNFNTLNRATGNRVKRQYVDPDTGAPVEAEDQVKGYAVSKGHYVIVEDEELDAIRIESTHSIDIEGFVPRAQVDQRYFDAPYYLAPQDKVSEEAFGVIRDAMRDKKMAGIGRVVIARRERPVLLEPLGRGILATTLRYANEVRDAALYFDDIPDAAIPAEMKDLAEVIIERKTTNFDPKSFEDRYESAVLALLKSKDAGKPAAAAGDQPAQTNVINIMEALRRSIAAERAEGSGDTAGKSQASAQPKAKAPSKATGAKDKPADTAPAPKPRSRKA